MDFLEVIWLFVVDISVVFDQYWESNTQRSNSQQNHKTKQSEK